MSRTFSPNELAHAGFGAWPKTHKFYTTVVDQRECVKLWIAHVYAESAAHDEDFGYSKVDADGKAANTDHGPAQLSNKWQAARLEKWPDFRNPYMAALASFVIWEEWGGNFQAWTTDKPIGLGKVDSTAKGIRKVLSPLRLSPAPYVEFMARAEYGCRKPIPCVPAQTEMRLSTMLDDVSAVLTAQGAINSRLDRIESQLRDIASFQVNTDQAGVLEALADIRRWLPRSE